MDVFVLYMLFHDRPDIDAKALFKKHNNGQTSIASSAQSFENRGGVEILTQTVGVDIQLPPDEALQYFGRGFDEVKAADFKGSKNAIIVIGASPFDKEHHLLKNINRTVGKMALDIGAYVMDGQDSLIFIPEAFLDLRLAEINAGHLSSAQLGIRAYPHGEGFRGVTMGLEKFGQYDFAVPAFNGPQMPRVNALMEIASQYFIEANEPIEPGVITLDVTNIENQMVKSDFSLTKRPGVKGKTTFKIDFVEPVSGDPEVLLGPVYQNGQSLENILSDLFGEGEKPSEGVALVQLQEAIGAARGRAVQILNNYSTLKLSGHRMSVAVELPDRREVVWAEVMDWQNGQGRGLLLSDAAGLKSGSDLAFSPAQIMDFKLMGPQDMVEIGGIDDMVNRLE